MKKCDINYTPLNRGCIRMPMLSYSALTDALADSEAWTQLCHENFFLESIYYASSEFHRQLTAGTRDNPKREKSLYKYLSRAATRCTPFGRFAAVGTFHTGSDTNLGRPDILPAKARFTIETSFLEKLAQKLMNAASIPHLTLCINHTLFESGREYRYEARQLGGATHSFTVKKTPVLKSIVRHLNKCDTITLLYPTISEEYDIDRDSFDRYILQLIDSGLIITELMPRILDKESYLPELIEIAHRSGNKDVEKQLKECAEFIRQVNASSHPVKIIEQFLDKEWVKQMHKADTPIVQSDSYISDDMHFTISDDIIDQIKELLAVNSMLSRGGTPYALGQFIGRYESTYENSPESLVKATDEETGIGYGNMRQVDTYHMLRGLGHGGGGYPQPSSLTLSTVQRRLLNIIESRDYNHRSIALEKYFPLTEQHDLSTLNLGRSLNVMFQIIGDNNSEFVASEVRFCGPSALNLLGRFAYGSDEINSLCSEIAEKENELIQDDEVIAEISYIPNSRSVNVLHRSPWHCHTIEYLSPGNDKGRSVPVSDLCIHVKGRGIRLYSSRIKKYIIPRMSSAHNYSNNTCPLYRFLGDMQSQNNRLSNAFMWGSLESVFSHLPRLTYKRIIVQPEKWRINVGEYKKKNSRDISGLREAIRKAGCTDRIIFREGDNCLWVDTGNDLALSAMLDASRRMQNIWVEEFIAPEGNIGINECILPFVRNHD